MLSPRLILWLFIVYCLIPLCTYADSAPSTSPIAFFDTEPILPIPPATGLDAAKIALGQRLFHDVRLSQHQARSCATCHRVDHGGDDGRPRSLAAGDRLYPRNTPTIFNVALNTRYNWDGNQRTLEATSEAALLSPDKMAANWSGLLAKLKSTADDVAAFKAIYREEPSREHVLDALVAYQRSLLTPNSRFDQYLRGRRDALTEAEKQGYQLFKAYGCAACHQGVNAGGNMFQKFGIVPTDKPPRDHDADDPGRFAITGMARDQRVFRVPSLRNVGVTAPYYHDGRVDTLAGAVDLMARRQLGKVLVSKEVELIVQFLHTLTGTYQGKVLSQTPPPSPPQTQKDTSS